MEAYLKGQGYRAAGRPDSLRGSVLPLKESQGRHERPLRFNVPVLVLNSDES